MKVNPDLMKYKVKQEDVELCLGGRKIDCRLIQKQHRSAWGLFWAVAVCVAIILIKSCTFVHAAEIPEETAVGCLIGEAANQGYEGLLYVGEALRKRGSTVGVYGCKASHIYKEPKWVWDMARKAWHESASTNHTQGADHWENIKSFGKPYWADSMVKTLAYKDHVFYREVKR